MTTINYLIEGDIIFARELRDDYDDPQFTWPPQALRLMPATYVMSDRVWRGILFPRDGFRYETYFSRPSWVEANRTVWTRWAEENGLLAPAKPSKPKVTIKYNAIELFTALCGDVMVVKKVVR